MQSEETKKLAKVLMYLALENAKTEINLSRYIVNYSPIYSHNTYTTKKEKTALFFGLFIFASLIISFTLLLIL